MSVALLSVYDKTGIVDFAFGLRQLGFEILASGGTAKALAAAGVPVIDVARLVGAPILGHRVVTLSRRIHAALLARDTPEDLKELWDQARLKPIDLVCVDLYPLEATIRDPKATPDSVRESTDIGGPTLLRSAAKGGRIVVSRSADRQYVLDWLKSGKSDEAKFKRALAARAEYEVARYCLASARYLSEGDFDGLLGEKVADCKYGENPQQAPAAVFETTPDGYLGPRSFKVEQGAISYNNYTDLDRLITTFVHVSHGLRRNGLPETNLAIAVKHGNACGAALREERIEAISEALRGDDRAVFGGVLLFDAFIGEAEAQALRAFRSRGGQPLMLDAIVAPGFSEAAKAAFQTKSGAKWKLIANPELSPFSSRGARWFDRDPLFRQIRGGFLRQPNYAFAPDFSAEDFKVYGELTDELKRDLIFAWAIGATSNSNTVTVVRDAKLLGNGVGQQDRVGACGLAISRASDAGHLLDGAVAYSDSFFPFTDGPLMLARAGIKAILATSGSIRDNEVVAAMQREGVTLCLMPDSKARGFFRH